MAIQVESPIGNNGSRLALADKRIDGAIIVESSTKAIDRDCTPIAQTPVVVAIGPGIQTRSLSTNDLIEIIGGGQKRWAGGLQKKFILRTGYDPVHGAYANDGSPLGDALNRALLERRWPIVYPIDDPVLLISTRPGAVGFALLGNLRLRGIPVWTTELSDKSAPTLRMSLCLGRKPSPTLKAFTRYVRSEEARQLIIDWGFAFESGDPQ